MLGLLTKKKKNEPEKQALPIIDVQDYIKRSDGQYVGIMQVDSINSDLLAQKELLQAMEQIQRTLNLDLSRFQILISSEPINLDSYKAYIDKKIEEATKDIYLERLIHYKDFINRLSDRTKTIKKFYIAFESQFKNESDALKELEDIGKAISENLNKGRMYCHRLDRHKILRILYEKLNPNLSFMQPYDDDMSLQDIAPNPIQLGGDHYILDSRYYRCFYIFKYPTSVKKLAWLKDLFDFKGDISFSMTLNSTDKSKMVTSLSNRVSELEAELLGGKLKPKDRKIHERKFKSADKMLDQIQEDNLYYNTFIITLAANSLDELNSQSKLLESRIKSLRMRSRRLSYMELNPFWYSLPILYKSDVEKYNKYNMMSSVVASTLPFDSSVLQENTGVLMGKNMSTDDVVITDRRNRKRHKNGNMAILGMSGSGKSFAAFLDAMRNAEMGRKIYMIDPEREYNRLPGANVIVFSLASKYCTNVFHIRSAIFDSDNEHDDGQANVGLYLQQKISNNMSFFDWIIPDMTPEEKALLRKAQVEAYKNVCGLTFESKTLPDHFPILSDLVNELEKLQGAQRIARLIKDDYVDGIYATTFNGQTNWDLNADINILDIHELSDDLRPKIMDLLQKDIWEDVKKDRNQEKEFYIDELHILADKEKPESLKFVFNLAKRIRKYGGNLVPITQNVGDLIAAGQYGEAIINNCYFKLYMMMSDKDIEALKSFTKFSEKELQVISGETQDNMEEEKGMREGILVVGTKRVHIGTMASMDELRYVDPAQYVALGGE